MRKINNAVRILLAFALILTQLPSTIFAVSMHDTITGTLFGRVIDQTGTGLGGVRVQVINQETGNKRAVQTDDEGRYQVTFLPLGRYTIDVSKSGYTVTRPTKEPIRLQLNQLVETAPDIQMRASGGVPIISPTPMQPATPTQTTVADESAGKLINRVDATRRFNADERLVILLPLGGIRTFDDLAFLSPGVAPPPAVQGVVGPGIGAGIGTAGQFSVNGQRARSNNFTVDGSDNNDEDIGVRRQGFVSLVPQSIESVQEFQVVTHLWDAELGRNLGSQVNAVSRSGGREVHGSFYDFATHDVFNARNFFDYAGGPSSYKLDAFNIQQFINGQPVGQTTVPVRIGTPSEPGTQDLVQPNPSGGENPFHRHQAGLTLGVPLSKKYFGPLGSDNPRTFFFGSFERQEIRAQQETHFVVPTVEERGFFNFGASGFTATPQGSETSYRFFPTFLAGDAVYSLYPFPNNPIGPYGRNTLTQVLPADARGSIFSLKFDHNFTLFSPEITHQLTGRYNFTNDERQVPAIGNAIFSSMEPHVGTQNLSLFLNSQISASLANQLRGSYGRTRLRFEPLGNSALIGSQAVPDNKYLLNARRLPNFSDPRNPRGFVDYRFDPLESNQVFRQVEDALGPVGQLIVAPYSPVGVDPYLFPQARTNNTYQIADTLTYFRGDHTFKFGADIRRTQLNSFFNRNYRSQVIFGGTLDLTGALNQRFPDLGIPFPNLSQYGPTPGFFRGTDLAALGIPTGIFQSLSAGLPDSTVGLRFWQHNFFFNDNWRVRPGLTIDYGLRYEYNTVPRSVDDRIERTFDLSGIPGVNDQLSIAFGFINSEGEVDYGFEFPTSNLVTAFNRTRDALRQIIGGRNGIFDPDRNNFAPHFSFAWDPWHSSQTQAGKTIIRGGFGVYYDLALGSVVSQSRNVFPNFIPVNLDVNTLNNLGGAFDSRFFDQNLNNGNGFIRIINPAYLPLVVINNAGQIQSLNCPGGSGAPVASIICPGTLNNLGVPSGALQALLGLIFNPSGTNLPDGEALRQSGGGLAFTLPDKKLRSPYAYHYNLQLERELFGNVLFNLAYVGTRGLKLTRFRTPNGGINSPTFPVDPLQIHPTRGLVPAVAFTQELFPGVRGFRSDPRLGAYTIFDSSANSTYHALQTSLTKRFSAGHQFTAAYTWSHAIDDVSDVFDLAGAFSLPQNDQNLAAERGNANFDLRHRLSFSLVSDLPGLRRFNAASGASRFWLGGWQLASIVVAQTGQPFTVNTSFDVNLDGNLTDRLNTAGGLAVRDGRDRIVILAKDLGSLLPQVIDESGNIVPRDGAVGRNTFRSNGAFKVDLTLIKNFRIKEGQDMVLRVEAFNLFNRTHFGIPVRILEAPSFGRSVNTSLDPRQIQFAVKYVF